MYPDERVARLVTQGFVPVRVHVREQAKAFHELGERYGAQWTPTILVLDDDGAEQHRIEGFLDAPDFLAQLELGLGKAAFKAKKWRDAQAHFRKVVDEHANTDAAPEALYWAGVSRYKDSGDAAALKETAAAFQKQYQGSVWAKKSSVWRG